MTSKKKKDLGKKILTDFSAYQDNLEVQAVETGIIPLDIVLGGGYEPGTWIQLGSKQGGGKSTLLLDVARRAIARGENVAWLDVERALHAGESGILRKMGLLPYVGHKLGARFLLIQNNGLFNYEDLYTVFDSLIAARDTDTPYQHIFIDSMTAVNFLEDDAGPADGGMGSMSRMASNFLRKYKGRCTAYGITVWHIEQARIKTEGTGRFMKVTVSTSGGNASEHFPDVRLWIDRGAKLTRKEDTATEKGVEIVYGRANRITSLKSRVERPEIPMEMYVIYGEGISNILTLEAIFHGHGFLDRARNGTWTTAELPGLPEVSNARGRGMDSFRDLLIRHYDRVVKWLKENGYLRLAHGVSTRIMGEPLGDSPPEAAYDPEDEGEAAEALEEDEAADAAR